MRVPLVIGPYSSSIYLASFLTRPRACTGLRLTAIASFCLSGAVVLGVVNGTSRHGAELALEGACDRTATSPTTPCKAADVITSAESSDPAIPKPAPVAELDSPPPPVLMESLALEEPCDLTVTPPAPCKAADMITSAESSDPVIPEPVRVAELDSPPGPVLMESVALEEACDLTVTPPAPCKAADMITSAESSDPVIPKPAPVAELDSPSEHPLLTTPLPPRRPRDLLPRVRLAPVRVPIEFRLAERGSNF